MREGRWFNATDTNKSRRVFVVDETFANRYFAGKSAVGQHLTFDGQRAKPEDWPEIIGVVGNVLHNGVEEKSGNQFLYHPLEQKKRRPRQAASSVAVREDAVSIRGSIPRRVVRQGT